MKRSLLLLAAAVAVFAQEPAAKAPAAAAPAAPALENGLYATITTSMGSIKVKLFEKESPVTVRNFSALARGTKPWRDPKTGAMMNKPFYPGTTFHRVIPGFMIQGGDPTGTGMGDGGLKPIPDEFDPSLKFDKPGKLAMANAGPRTGTCQFFITDAPTPHLNGLHTIFGEVIEGQAVVGNIARTPRDNNDKPRTPVKIVSVLIKRVGPPPTPPAPAGGAKKAVAPVKKAATPPAVAPKK